MGPRMSAEAHASHGPVETPRGLSIVMRHEPEGERSLSGLMILTPSNSFSLSVTTTQSFAPATAAMIVSSALRGQPRTLPPAMSFAHTRPAFSSKGSPRPANRA